MPKARRAISPRKAPAKKQRKPSRMIRAESAGSRASASHESRARQKVASDPFDQVRLLNSEIGATSDAGRRRALMRMRDGCAQEVIDASIQVIERAYKESQSSGWRAWLDRFSDGVAHFRVRYSLALCLHTFPFGRRNASVVEYRRAVECMFQNRWEETYEEIAALSMLESLKPVIRARLVTMRGQIELFRFSMRQKAGLSFQEAATITHDNAFVVAAQGDYWLAEQEKDRAEACYRKAIEVAKHESAGYVGMGEKAERAEDFAEADDWYRQAISNAGGDGVGFGRLLRLLGRKDQLAVNEREMLELSERKICVDPESEYETCIAVGDCYLANARREKAKAWYEKAMSLCEEWPRAYVAMGQMYKEGGGDDIALAEQFLKQAIKRARECPDAYLELVAIHQEKERWDKALKLFEHFPSRPRQWIGYARTSAARMHLELGNRPQAETILFEELRRAPDESYAPAAIERLASELFRKHRDTASAIRIYEQLIHALTGLNLDVHRSQLASAANGRANIEYEQSRFAAAVPFYRIATENAPSNGQFYLNLAQCLLRVGDASSRVEALAESIRCYERAQQLMQTTDNGDLIARLRRRYKLAQTYGERALRFLNVVTPIGVEVASNLVTYVEGPDGRLSDELMGCVALMRDSVKKGLGASIPGLSFRGNEGELAPGAYVISLGEIPRASGNLSTERKFCLCSKMELSSAGVKGEAASDPLTGEQGFWIAREDWEAVESRKLNLWPLTRFLVRHLESVVRANIGEFVGHQAVMNLLTLDTVENRAEIKKLGDSAPMLTEVTSICRALLAEYVPISPLREIVDAVSRQIERQSGRLDTVEYVRGLPAFRRKVVESARRTHPLQISARFETAIGRSIYEHDSRQVLAMEPQECQAALSAIRDRTETSVRALIVEDGRLRPFVRKLVELEFPQLSVFSRAELAKATGIADSESIDLGVDAPPSTRSFAYLKNDTTTDRQGPAPGVKNKTVPGITVFVSPDFQTAPSAFSSSSFESLHSLMLDGLFYELGIIVPEVRLEVDTEMARGSFRICMNGADMEPIVGLGSDEFLVNDTADRLALFNIQARATVSPANGNEVSIVKSNDGAHETCRQVGLVTWDARGFLILHVAAAIRRMAAQFQTEQVTQHQVELLAESFPELVRCTLQRYELSMICRVLGLLLEEEVSIRDLRGILESLLALNGTTDVDMSRFIVFTTNADALCPVTRPCEVRSLADEQLADFVRISLKRQITHRYTRGANTLVVYLLDPAIETRIAATAGEPITADERTRLSESIRKQIETGSSSRGSRVILTTMGARRALSRVLRAEFPNLAVLSYQELAAELNIQPVARIEW